jgi:hypothetical protein
MECRKTRTRKRRCHGTERENLHEKNEKKEWKFESRRNDKLSNG